MAFSGDRMAKPKEPSPAENSSPDEILEDPQKAILTLAPRQWESAPRPGPTSQVRKVLGAPVF